MIGEAIFHRDIKIFNRTADKYQIKYRSTSTLETHPKAPNSIDNARFSDGPTYGYGSGYGGIHYPSWSAPDNNDTNSTVPSPYALGAGDYSWASYQAFPGAQYPSSEFSTNFSDPNEFNSTEYNHFPGGSSYGYGLGYGGYQDLAGFGHPSSDYSGNISDTEVFNFTQYDSYPEVPSYGYGLGYGGNFSQPNEFNSTEYPSYPEGPSYGYGYGQSGYPFLPGYTGFPIFATVSSSHPVHFLNPKEPNSTESTPFSEGTSDDNGHERKFDEEEVKEETIEKPKESD